MPELTSEIKPHLIRPKTNASLTTVPERRALWFNKPGVDSIEPLRIVHSLNVPDMSSRTSRSHTPETLDDEIGGMGRCDVGEDEEGQSMGKTTRTPSPSAHILESDRPPIRCRNRKELCNERWLKTSACLKQFCTFLLSHVGLAVLVVLYSLLGGYVFHALEQNCERNVKLKMQHNRTHLVAELMRTWRDTQMEVLRLTQVDLETILKHTPSTSAHADTDRVRAGLLPNPVKLRLKTRADREKLLAGLSWYLAGIGMSRQILPPWWFSNQLNKTTTTSETSTLSTQPSTPIVTPHPEVVSEPLELNSTVSQLFPPDILQSFSDPLIIITTLDDLLPIIVQSAKRMEQNMNRLVENYVKSIVTAIKDEGWNGAESEEELNWTLEGGILYAVTIITTIGYGHVTPHTIWGRLLTMLYAVFGIPLFFCYLTNNGNYLAQLFQTCYIRMCRPASRKIAKKCCHARHSTSATASSSVTTRLLGRKLSNRISPSGENGRIGMETRSNGGRVNLSLLPITSDIPKKISLIPNSHEMIPLWTDESHMMITSPTRFFNTYPKSPSYRLTDDWEPYCTTVSADCTVEPSAGQCYHPRPINENPQPPSPYLDRRNRKDHEASLQSSTSSTPSSPVPLRPETSRFQDNTTYDACDSNDTLDTGVRLSKDLRSNLLYPIGGGAEGVIVRQKKMSQAKSIEETPEQITVPITLTMCMMTVYILIGATVFTVWESQDYVKWSYFCFVTLSTIGFGDIVPGTKVDSQNPKEKMIILAVYMAVGLSVFAMCFKLMEEEVIMKLKRIGRRVGLLRPPEPIEEYSDSDEMETPDVALVGNELVRMKTIRIHH